MNIHLRLLAWGLLVLFSVQAHAQAQKTQLVFGVVPQQSPQKLAATWGPILREVSEDANVQLVFATAKDIPTFEKNVSDGKYDLAYMNPYHYVEFAKKPGYRAMLKQANKQIQGIIVASKQSAFKSLNDLQNAQIAFPAPAAFAASIIPQSQLAQLGVDYIPMYVSSHDSVYMNVARGFMPAGGGIIRTFEAMPKQVKDQLVVLWHSDNYSPHAIAAHPNMTTEVFEAIRASFLNLNAEKYQPKLEAINFKGFEIAHDEGWDDVRKLSISHQLNR